MNRISWQKAAPTIQNRRNTSVMQGRMARCGCRLLTSKMLLPVAALYPPNEMERILGSKDIRRNRSRRHAGRDTSGHPLLECFSRRSVQPRRFWPLDQSWRDCQFDGVWKR